MSHCADMFGEIILCDFPFSSGKGNKIRPALILFDLGRDSIICRVTSVLHTGSFDILIKDWKTAGLLKPSVARIDRIITAEKTIFIRHLGVLSPLDLETVRTAWNQHMRL